MLYLLVLCGAVAANLAKGSDIEQVLCMEKYEWESASYEACEFAEDKLTRVELHCKADNLLAFKRPDAGWNATYLVKFEENGFETMDVSVHRTEILTYDALDYDKEYRVLVWWTFFGNNTIYGPARSDWVKTWKMGHQLQGIAHFEMDELQIQEGSGKFFTTLAKWQPGNDSSCFYHLVVIGGSNGEGYVQMEMLEPEGNFSLRITDLELEHDYYVGVSGIDAGMRREGPRAWRNFTMPKCFNKDYCNPTPPTGLTVQEVRLEEVKEEVLCDVSVSWTKADPSPDYYIVSVITMEPKHNRSRISANVTGRINSVKFDRILLGFYYEVTIAAYSKHGRSDEVIQQRFLHFAKLSGANKFTLISIGLIAFSVLVIATLIWRKNNRNFNLFSNKSKIAANTTYVSDQWEVKVEDLIVEEVLGEGAFGIVKKGILRRGGIGIHVAVKTVKDYPQEVTLKDFREEIRIMKTVGYHPNIVSMLGFCYQVDKPLLIVEFCARGNLLNYLRSVWNGLLQADFQAPTLRSQFQLAKQISEGMSYLAKMRMVHRDLAARNILICEDGTAKVSDFGLSRDIYADDVYCQLGNGKVPLRWMALECITRFVYTTESDVWSFGVLLWEIATLGAYPYSSLSNQEVIAFLRDGNRLDIPPNCVAKFYRLMENCWRTSPKDRLNFDEISDKLTCLIEETHDDFRVTIYNTNDLDIV